ncbi:MAG: hypothetical protein ACLGI5_07530 [Thermoleophilia bacterium]
MAFQRGIDGSEPLRAQPISAPAGAREIADAASSLRVATGTLACPRCDAPIGLGGRAARFAEHLDCPFCRHTAALREFLSLGAPTRPARVEVRARPRARSARR